MPEAFPSTSDIRSVRFWRQENTQIFESPLNGSVQTAVLTGGKWLATFRLLPMTRAEAQKWIVFLTRLRGMSGRFYAHDPANAAPLGNIVGSTPTISGAGQTGTSLNTAGWAISTNGVLLAGDASAYDTPTSWRERNIVVSDVNSDGFGDATISLAYPMRESPVDSSSLIVTNASCIMRLLDDEQAAWDVQEALQFGIEFTAIEVFE